MISVNRKAIRNILMLMVLFLIAASHFGPMIGITSMFELDQAGTVAVWFESFLYLACAGLLALVAFSPAQTKGVAGWRWGQFSLFLLYLSINTTAEINKKIVGKLTGWLWMIPGSLFDLVLFLVLAAALVIVLWPALSGIPVHIRREMFLAGVVFGFGAIVVDDLGDILYRGSNEWLYMLEELLEFAGFVILIDALLALLADRGGVITLNFGENPPTGHEGSD